MAVGSISLWVTKISSMKGWNASNESVTNTIWLHQYHHRNGCVFYVFLQSRYVLHTYTLLLHICMYFLLGLYNVFKKMSQHFFVLVVFLPSSQGSHYHLDENIHGKLPCPDMIYVMKTFLWCFRALPTKQLIRGMPIGFVIFIGTSTTFHQHTSIFQSNLLFLRLG